MKNVLALLCIVIASSSFAQIKLQGVVKDSIGTPLELANVIAINKDSNSLESYGITDSNGKFVLSLSKNTLYNIQISYIGLKSVNETLTTKEADITKNYSMVSDNQLDAVEITYEMPVTIKGDT